MLVINFKKIRIDNYLFISTVSSLVFIILIKFVLSPLFDSYNASHDLAMIVTAFLSTLISLVALNEFKK